MELIYHTHKAFGCAEAGCWSEISHYLISPRAVVGVLGQRHELNVGIAHFLYIWDKLISRLFVAEKVAVGVLLPRT